MPKYVKVVEGLMSNANGFQYKLDEVNVAKKWNPHGVDPSEMGGFNFSTEEKILRFIFRGTVMYDVILPDDAEVVECESESCPHGVFRANKIIITNPREITEDMVIDIYKKTNLPAKSIYQCLVCLLYKNHLETVKYIIKDFITKENVTAAIEEFERYSATSSFFSKGSFVYDDLPDVFKEVYDMLIAVRNS